MTSQSFLWERGLHCRDQVPVWTSLNGTFLAIVFWTILISTCYSSLIGCYLNTVAYYLEAPQLSWQYVWIRLLSQMASLQVKDASNTFSTFNSTHCYSDMHPDDWCEAKNASRTKDPSLRKTSLAMHSSPWTIGPCTSWGGTAAVALLSAGTTGESCAPAAQPCSHTPLQLLQPCKKSLWDTQGVERRESRSP